MAAEAAGALNGFLNPFKRFFGGRGRRGGGARGGGRGGFLQGGGGNDWRASPLQVTLSAGQALALALALALTLTPTRTSLTGARWARACRRAIAG